MGKWLFPAIFVQLVCAFRAASLDPPVRPRRPATQHSAVTRAHAGLGWLGYRAVRARSIDGRRALAEECMRVGRYADARLLFKSCMVGRDADDPQLVAGLQQATALMGRSARPVEIDDEYGTTIAL